MDTKITHRRTDVKVLLGTVVTSSVNMPSLAWAAPPAMPKFNLRDAPIWVRATNPDNRIIGLTPPEQGKLRTRKPVTRSSSQSRYKTPSWKMGRMIHCESQHERNVVRLLDFSPDVTQFYEQPLRIDFRINGQQHFHTPDILIVTAAGKELWEIKQRKDAANRDIADRTQFLTAQLPAHGFYYRLVIADDLGRNPRMDNVIKIINLGRNEISARERESLRQVVLKSDIVWGDVLAGKYGLHGVHHVCRLVLEGALWFDAEQFLTEETILTRAYAQPGCRGDHGNV